MKLIRTKAAGLLALEGLMRVTLIPASNAFKKVSGRYHETQDALRVKYIEDHLDELTPQEKFDAVFMYRSELSLVKDDIMEAARTVIYHGRNQTTKGEHEFLIAYSFLYSSGVTKFTPAIEEYYKNLTSKVKV